MKMNRKEVVIVDLDGCYSHAHTCCDFVCGIEPVRFVTRILNDCDILCNQSRS